MPGNGRNGVHALPSVTSMGVCQKMLQRRGKEKRSPDGLRFPRSYVEGNQRRCVHQPHVKVRHGGIPDICHGHTDGVRGEKICHVEKFQISVHDRC